MADFNRDTGKEAKLRRWYRHLDEGGREHAFMYVCVYGLGSIESQAQEWDTMYNLVNTNEPN